MIIQKNGVRFETSGKAIIAGAVAAIVLVGCATVFGDGRARQQSDQGAERKTVSLNFINVLGAPLKMTNFSVTYRRQTPIAGTQGSRSVSGGPDNSMAPESYVMDASWAAENTGDRAVRSELFKFTHTATGHKFYVQERFHLDAINDPAGNDAKTFSLKALTIDEDPLDLTVELAQVSFADDDTWGTYPDILAEPSVAGDNWIARAGVDTRPVSLNHPRPHFAENARLNRIIGSVALRAVFSTDGLVRVINVVNPLPGGLTEEAIKAVEQMKCNPAVKDGRAVEFESNVTVSFEQR